LELKDLIKKCLKNDIKAQEQLYLNISVQLFGVCLKYSRSYADAQDNLQDGFLLVLHKLNKFEYKGSFEGWAKRIVINHILQSFRKTVLFEQVSENQFEDEPEDELDPMIDDVSMDYLMDIIQQLPDQYRLVFNLYVMDDFTHKEIASLLKISINTSKSNLSRARSILKQKIEIATNSIHR
jgi:RNA polymerase sigma factor (sigma-70 family)